MPSLLTLPIALAAAGLQPVELSAQAVHDVQPAALQADRTAPTAGAVAGGRLRFEPWAGALWDAFRNDGGSGAPAWIGAARFGYELGDGYGTRFRLIAEVARAEAGEAGTALLGDSIEVEFASRWWLTTTGVEYDVRAGWSGLTLEGQAGVAWVTLEVTGGDSIPVGTPGTTASAEAEPYAAGRLGLSAWRHLTHTMQARIRVEDVLVDGPDGLEHSPALGLGIRFVFE